MPVNIPQGGFSPEQQSMINNRFGTGSQYGSAPMSGLEFMGTPTSTGQEYAQRQMARQGGAAQAPGFSLGGQAGAGGPGSAGGGKPGGAPGQMGPQQPGGGKAGGPPGQMGSQAQGGKPGGAPGQMGQAPQPGFPPPTGKPGMPPVNPSALGGQRPGDGLLNLPQQQGVIDQSRVDLNAAPQPGPHTGGRYQPQFEYGRRY